MSKFASKSGVIIAKTIIKAYISKRKFQLVNFLIITFRALVNKTFKLLYKKINELCCFDKIIYHFLHAINS